MMFLSFLRLLSSPLWRKLIGFQWNFQLSQVCLLVLKKTLVSLLAFQGSGKERLLDSLRRKEGKLPVRNLEVPLISSRLFGAMIEYKMIVLPYSTK
jgi:hypothetical protein